MPLPKDTYFEFSLTAPDTRLRHTEAAETFFTWARIAPERIVLTAFRSRARWSFYTRSDREIHRVLDVFAAQKPAALRVKVRVLGPRDWRDRWQLYFHTMPLGRRFTVVPLWEKKHFKPVRALGRWPLFLDPCGAFGSGAHETTRLMVRMMESLPHFRSFLDIGTGTGILAAAAVKLGAERIEGVDIDRISIAAARKNFRLNGGKGGVFSAGDIRMIRISRPYDMVAANFISADLMACRKAILSCVAQGGVLLVSGISLKNLPGFLLDFKAPGFRRSPPLRGRSWAGLIYRKMD